MKEEEVLRYLELLAPYGHDSNGKPLWREPGRLEREPEALEVAARHRFHPTIGPVARDVLRDGPAKRVAHALRLHPPVDRPFEDGDFRSFMEDVRHDLGLLVARLSARGWPAQVEGCDSYDRRWMDQAEEVTGARLPPSLRQFWEIVGSVDLVWDVESPADRPDFGLGLNFAELDPLYVDCAEETLEEEMEAWPHFVRRDIGDPYPISISPDRLHKANTSGGNPYGFELPSPAADPVLLGEEHELPFTEYLRLSLQWAGFPGLASYAEKPGVAEWVAGMTEGFRVR